MKLVYEINSEPKNKIKVGEIISQSFVSTGFSTNELLLKALRFSCRYESSITEGRFQHIVHQAFMKEGVGVIISESVMLIVLNSIVSLVEVEPNKDGTFRWMK